MQSKQIADNAGTLLRFVYRDTVVSFSYRSRVTFGEVAQTLVELSQHRPSTPVAIDILMAKGHKPHADLYHS